MWTPEYRNCPVCQSEKRKNIGFRGGEAHRSGAGVKTSVVRCGNCSLLYTYPTLIPNSNPYDESDFSDYFKNHPDDDKIGAGRNLAKEAEKYVKVGSVLEVGCGGGGMLVGFKERGWNCVGIEMTEAFAEVAEKRGLTVIRKPVEQVEFDQKFDAIIFPAIIEHLYDPLTVLRKCVSALSSSGVVHIEVPNESALSLKAGNLYYRLRGLDWSLNLSPTFIPFHVVGFSPKSMKNLLKAAGLKLLDMEVTTYRTTLPDNVNLIERFGMTFLQKFGGMAGFGDGLSVWAKKIREDQEK